MAVPRSPDLLALDHALNALATLYQFRSIDAPTFGPLTVSQSYCLRILYTRGPQSMGALAADLAVRLSTMTGIVDQLQAKKMVERVGHPEDRRSLHVRLTPKGHKLYRAAHEAFLSHLEPLVEKRTPASRRQILEFLADLIPAIQGWREHPRKVERRGRANSSG